MADSSPQVEVDVTRMATGGEAVARLDDGRVAFVRGALAGERVRMTVTEVKRRFVRGVVTEILSPSVLRVEAACPHARSGQCGGCDWMHLAASAQPSVKCEIVVEQLRRLGGIDEPSVVAADPSRGRRTTVRCGVVEGRAGYRMRRSHRVFAADQCPAAHPLIEDLLIEGRFGAISEVTLRAGAGTGERVAIVDGPSEGVSLPADVLISRRGDSHPAMLHELVAGRRWRISAESFFQTSQEGAEAVVAAVSRALAGSQGPVVDLYAGVGLLGGGAVPERVAVAVEQTRSSVADARVNLGPGVEVIQSRVESWPARRFETVIADPARRGLAVAGVEVIDGTGASRVALVSCDPASLGRDTALLIGRGFRLVGCEVIDMFPDTSRIETVSRFDR